MSDFIFYTAQDIQGIISDKIKKIRKSKGWTQKEMALRSDIPLSTYARFEQLGECSLYHLSKMIATLGRGDEIEKILNVAVKNESPMDLYRKVKGKK